MRPHDVALAFLLATPGAALRAQAVGSDSAPADPAVRLVSAAYLRATTAAAPDQAPLLRTALRLADSVIATSPPRATAGAVFLVRGLAALSLSRELRAAATQSGRCADARAARAQAEVAADGLLTNTGPGSAVPGLRASARAWRLAHAEDDSTARLVRRLCPAPGG